MTDMVRVKVWDLPTRIVHWSLALTVLGAFLTGDDEGGGTRDLHMLFGHLAAGLVVFRVLWGFFGGQYSRFAAFVSPSRLMSHLKHLVGGRPEAELGHNPLGGLAVLALLGLVLAVVASGHMMAPAPGVEAEGGGDLHEVLAYGLLGLVGLHVAAVAVMSRLTHDNLLGAMVTGVKRRALAQPPQVARGGIVALLLCLAVVAAFFAWEQTWTWPTAQAAQAGSEHERD